MLRSFEVAAIGAVVYCLSRVFKIYSDIIRNAEHYVYLENQFFITAIGDQHAPIRNTIGRAIVDAVVRAGKEGRKFKVIAVILGLRKILEKTLPRERELSWTINTSQSFEANIRSSNRLELRVSTLRSIYFSSISGPMTASTFPLPLRNKKKNSA
jgi:hypothetical protein